MNYVAYVDGTCMGNGTLSGQVGGSYAIYETENISIDLDHNALKHEIPLLQDLNFSITVSGRQRPTNNLAEAVSMAKLFTALYSERILHPNNRIIIYNDSELIRKQLMGVYKVKNMVLKDVYKRMQSLLLRYMKKYDRNPWEVVELRHISGDAMKTQTVIAH